MVQDYMIVEYMVQEDMVLYHTLRPKSQNRFLTPLLNRSPAPLETSHHELSLLRWRAVQVSSLKMFEIGVWPSPRYSFAKFWLRLWYKSQNVFYPKLLKRVSKDTSIVYLQSMALSQGTTLLPLPHIVTTYKPLWSLFSCAMIRYWHTCWLWR